MGTNENAAVVKRGYEAFNTADMKALTEIFDENASWHTPGRSSLAGDRQGHEAVFTQFGRYGGDTGGTFKATLQHLLQSDDGSVVGVHRTPRSVTASAWTLAAASSSRSRTAGLPTVESTFTTSTLGTNSGRSPAGASPAGHAAVRGSTYIDARRSGFRTVAVRVAARKRLLTELSCAILDINSASRPTNVRRYYRLPIFISTIL